MGARGKDEESSLAKGFRRCVLQCRSDDDGFSLCSGSQVFAESYWKMNLTFLKQEIHEFTLVIGMGICLNRIKRKEIIKR